MDLNNMPVCWPTSGFQESNKHPCSPNINLLKQQFPWQQDTCDLQVNQWKPQYLKQHYVSLAKPGNNR